MFLFYFIFFCNSTYSLYPEHWIIQEPVYVLHLITCHGRIMRRLAELLLLKEFLDILVDDLMSSGITVCQGFVVRGFQTVSLFAKDVKVFLRVPCTLCVRGFYGLGIGRFLHVRSVCWKFWYQRFLQILFFCCCFVGLQFVRWFLQVLYVCQSFGCQNIASGSLVWCVRGFKV